MSNNRKMEIKILLRDYMNFLPSGQQEAFLPVGAMGVITDSNWPITPELEKRMDRSTLVGETYGKLDDALVRLNDEHPRLYNAIMRTYLREEAGHRDDDHMLSKLNVASDELVALIVANEEAIEKLVEYLKGEDLYIRWPQKAAGPRPGQNMEDKHNELFAIFSRFYYEQDLPYRTALTNAVLKMEDHTGKPYYSRRHADRIVKARMKALDEEG